MSKNSMSHLTDCSTVTGESITASLKEKHSLMHASLHAVAQGTHEVVLVAHVDVRRHRMVDPNSYLVRAKASERYSSRLQPTCCMHAHSACIEARAREIRPRPDRRPPSIICASGAAAACCSAPCSMKHMMLKKRLLYRKRMIHGFFTSARERV